MQDLSILYWIIHPTNMQTKQIAAVAVVIVVCIAAVAYYVLSDNGSDDRYVSTDDSGRLTVYGNANNDDYMNEDDIAALESIINGDMAETKYADANQDGIINENDVEHVRGILNGTVDRVYVSQIHGGSEEIASCPYPLTSVCVAGYETMTVIKSIGAVEYITCLTGASGDSFDENFYSDIYNLPKVGPDIWNVDIELISDYPVEAVVAMDSNSYVSNQTLLEQAGIDVIRIEAANGLSSLNGIVTLGFLFDCVDTANELMQFFDGILNDIESKLSTIANDDRVTGLFVTMSNYVEGVPSRSEYTGTMEIAGAVSVADDTTWEGKARKQFFIGDEWLLEPRFQADFIVHSRALGLGEVDLQSNWDTYSQYFHDMDAYKDGNYFILNSTLTPVMRIAFMATQFYPEVFGEDYAVDLLQEYYDRFITNVEDFDAHTDGVWVITSDMVDW